MKDHMDVYMIAPDGLASAPGARTTIATTLGRADTRALLQALPWTPAVTAEEVLIAALAQTLRQMMRGSRVLIDVTRDARRAGAAVLPLSLDLSRVGAPDQALRYISDVMRNASAAITATPVQASGQPQAQIRFTYAASPSNHRERGPNGVAAHALLSSGTGHSRAGHGDRYRLTLMTSVVDARLVMKWASDQTYHRDTIEEMALDYELALVGLVQGPRIR